MNSGIYVPWNVGIPCSEDTKKKISESQKKRYKLNEKKEI